MQISQFVQIQPDGAAPVYRQIVDQVTRKVMGGALSSGDEIPSVRLLATSLRVQVATVSKAYSILAQKGVLVRRRGRPMVVADRNRGSMPSADREALLRPTLERAAAEAQQLGLTSEEALQLYKSLLGVA